jgi:hypothetical protein
MDAHLVKHALLKERGDVLQVAREAIQALTQTIVESYECALALSLRIDLPDHRLVFGVPGDDSQGFPLSRH